MINLLPPDLKESYRFARRNAVLVHWVSTLVFVLVGLAAISAGGVFFLRQTASGYIKQADSAQLALQSQNQAATEKQVQDISGNVKLVVQVLSKEVLFSKLLKQIATIVPKNVTLTNINIIQAQTALDISANTTDYNAATQLQVNLADPANKIFSKADIVSIDCASNADSSDPLASKYPCKVVIRTLFSTNNPYLFISNQKAGS